jgi:outer membrane protein OmpA-like peptidoglycan-associated protein
MLQEKRNGDGLAGPRQPPRRLPDANVTRWLPWIVAGLLALGLLFLLTRCGKEPSALAPVAGAVPATAPGQVKLTFNVGSAAPGADAAAQLGAIIAWAKARPGARVAVSGYNDPGGEAAASEELAKNRALAVRNVLIGQGVDEEHVDMSTPIKSTGGPEERESRVEVSVHGN